MKTNKNTVRIIEKTKTHEKIMTNSKNCKKDDLVAKNQKRKLETLTKITIIKNSLRTTWERARERERDLTKVQSSVTRCWIKKVAQVFSKVA